jgi:hypothetical protein
MKNYCIDCEIKISINAKRCRSCANKGTNHPLFGVMGKNNPNYGRKCSFKTKEKISIAAKKRFKNPKNHPKYKDGRTLKKYYCIDCGIRITRQRKRCGSCATKKQLKNPKNNPAYIDGRSRFPYPIEFNGALKYKIRERDNFECQNCGMIEEEHIVVFGQVLHVHHIDYNKFNLEETNLITTCFSCNLRANYNRNFWEKHYSEKIKEIYNGKSIIDISAKPIK